jgi:hypothetical protein
MSLAQLLHASNCAAVKVIVLGKCFHRTPALDDPFGIVGAMTSERMRIISTMPAVFGRSGCFRVQIHAD